MKRDRDLDVFITGDGLRMVESNAEIPGGNEESYFLEGEYLEIFRPVARSFSSSFFKPSS